MEEFLETDNYILCPICGKEKFNKEDGFIFCNTCGWEGTINVDETLVELNGYSARDYKKIYEEYIKNHPDYIWKKDKEALDNFVNSFKDYGSTCPVCGVDSFEPDYRYCYNCGWKYNFVQAEYPDFERSANKLSLNQYKKLYEENKKVNPNYVWKDTKAAKIVLSDEQIKWLTENNIRTDFNKLTSDEEMHDIYDQIEKKQQQFYKKEDYDKFLFVKNILDTILDNI